MIYKYTSNERNHPDVIDDSESAKIVVNHDMGQRKHNRNQAVTSDSGQVASFGREGRKTNGRRSSRGYVLGHTVPIAAVHSTA